MGGDGVKSWELPKKRDFLAILASPIADGLNFFFPHGMLRAGSGAEGHRTFE